MFVKQLFLVVLLIMGGAAFGDSTPLKIGISVWSGYPENVSGFKESLKKGGYIENENVTYLYRNAGGDKQKQTEIAKEFRDEKVDLVFSLTTPGTILIKEHLPETTPIVFSIVTYPSDAGLIESFEYSGNNLVGTSNFVPLKNYVNLLKKAMPEVKRAAIFRRKGEPNSKIQTVNLARLLKRSGIEVQDSPASSIEEVIKIAKSIHKTTDVFITTTDTLMQGGGEAALIEISKATQTPILSSNKQGVLDGSTFGPVADFFTLGEMSGDMAIKILKEHESPSNLQSLLQDPPLILVNRKSLQAVKLELPENFKGFKYVD